MVENWTFWAILSAVFAALTAIFGKVGVTGIGADFAVFIRTVVILAALALILTARQEWQGIGGISGKSWLFLILSGLATGLSWVCYYRALQLGDASRVAPIDKLSVVLVAIFGVLFLGEKLSTTNWTGVALIGAGAILVAWR